MSDPYSIFPSFFSDDPRTGTLSYEQLQQRRRLAMTLAARNRPYPKTIGEGLTVLGEGIGDVLQERKLAAAEEKFKQAEEQSRKGLPAETSPWDQRPAAEPQTPIPPPATPAPSTPVPPSNVPPTAPMRQAAPSPVAQFRGENASPLPTDAAAEAVQAARLGATQLPNQAPQMSTQEWLQRIARNETGGQREPYKTIGPISRRGDYPYGKYQIMGENVREWSKKHLGTEMTPDQFLNDPDAQDRIATAQGQEYISKFGPERAAGAWFAGPNSMDDPRRRDTLGTHVAEYKRRFNAPLDGRGSVAQALAQQQMPERPPEEERQVLSDVTGMGGQGLGAAGPKLASLSNPMGNLGGGELVGSPREAITGTMAPPPSTAPPPTDLRPRTPPGMIQNALAQQQASAPPAAPIGAGSMAAPPAAVPAQPPPQQRIAQAPPLQRPVDPASQLIGPPQPEPVPPDRRVYGPTERETYARQQLANPNISDQAKRGFEIEATRLQAIRDAAFNQQQEIHKIKKQEWLAAQGRREAHNLADPQRQSELATAAQQRLEREGKIFDESEARILKGRLGGQDPDKFFTNLRTEQKGAELASQAMEDNQVIMKALKEGVISGFGANMRLNVSKLASFAFNNNLASEEAARTEIMRALGGSEIRAALSKINTGPSSNVELSLAKMMSGRDPSLEPKTIIELLHKSNEYNARSLNDFEDKRDYYLGGTRAERDYGTLSKPTAPPEIVQRLLENKGDMAARATYDDHFGKGAAALEIERAKRRERRGQ